MLASARFSHQPCPPWPRRHKGHQQLLMIAIRRFTFLWGGNLQNCREILFQSAHGTFSAGSLCMEGARIFLSFVSSRGHHGPSYPEKLFFQQLACMKFAAVK